MWEEYSVFGFMKKVISGDLIKLRGPGSKLEFVGVCIEPIPHTLEMIVLYENEVTTWCYENWKVYIWSPN